jgi:uroporphyrin-III C-methyltransferase/precorrin-2 dehydrogenase/sirohydrochlorin ferrochelatase
VVPGITSAVAAAALAGIPVTHRSVSTGFVVVSGHAEEAFRPALESLAPHSATVVVLMGLGRMKQVAALLIARGWAAATPAAVLLGASTAESVVHSTTLGALQEDMVIENAAQPGTIVVGEVVRLREALLPAQATDVGTAERTYAHRSR